MRTCDFGVRIDELLLGAELGAPNPKSELSAEKFNELFMLHFLYFKATPVTGIFKMPNHVYLTL